MHYWRKLYLRLKPVPHQVGAQVDPPPIASAHGRKERHVFAHHGKIVARVVEVEDALVVVVVVFVGVVGVVVWKQVDADRCAVHHCVGKRRNGVQRFVLRVQFRRGNRRVLQRGGI